MQEVNPDTDIDALLKDFICLEDESKKEDKAMIEHTKVEQGIVDSLISKLDEAEEVLKKNREPYKERIAEIEELQERTKSHLGLLMGDFKTMDLPLAKIEKRVTKKVTVADEAALAAVLVKTDTVVDGVNTFNVTFAKGLVKAGVLSKEALEVKETENIYVRRKENCPRKNTGHGTTKKESFSSRHSKRVKESLRTC